MCAWANIQMQFCMSTIKNNFLESWTNWNIEINFWTSTMKSYFWSEWTIRIENLGFSKRSEWFLHCFEHINKHTTERCSPIHEQMTEPVLSITENTHRISSYQTEKVLQTLKWTNLLNQHMIHLLNSSLAFRSGHTQASRFPTRFKLTALLEIDFCVTCVSYRNIDSRHPFCQKIFAKIYVTRLHLYSVMYFSKFSIYKVCKH